MPEPAPGHLARRGHEDDEEARDLLRSYGETYLRGETLNYTAVGRDAALATRTVQEYFQILDDSLLGFRLEAWAKSPRARLVRHPPVRRVVICEVPQEHALDGTDVVPWRSFFARFESWP